MEITETINLTNSHCNVLSPLLLHGYIRRVAKGPADQVRLLDVSMHITHDTTLMRENTCQVRRIGVGTQEVSELHKAVEYCGCLN